LTHNATVFILSQLSVYFLLFSRQKKLPFEACFPNKIKQKIEKGNCDLFAILTFISLSQGGLFFSQFRDIISKLPGKR